MHSYQAAMGRFRDWISSSLTMGAGALHKYSKSYGAPAQELADVRGSDGSLIDPLEINKAKAAHWGQYWQAERRPTESPELWPRLVRKAQEEERKEISPDGVKHSLKMFRARIGIGGNGQNPHWWRQLPDEGIQDLTRFLNMVEEKVAWPAAVLECVVALLPKSGESDRPITLTQGLYRLRGRIRRPTVGRCAKESAPWWDKVIEGSIALRAALCRQAAMEVSTTLRFASATALFDVEKFYDHAGLASVVAIGERVGYPLRTLALAFLVHSAPWRVSTVDAISERWWPRRSPEVRSCKVRSI